MNLRPNAALGKLLKDQRLIRAAGFHTMGDILEPGGNMIAWEEAMRRGIPAHCHTTFNELAAKLADTPLLDPSQSPWEFFVQEENPVGHQPAWKFMLPPTQLTSAWHPFMDCSCPVRNFKISGKKLIYSH